MPIPKGAQVRQVAPAIEGEVTARRFDESTDGMSYLVAFTGADGQPHERWFLESEITEAAQ